MWLIEADSLECGFRANSIEVARVSVLAHKLPESDLVAQHLNDSSCVFLINSLLQDKRFSVVQGTIHLSG